MMVIKKQRFVDAVSSYGCHFFGLALCHSGFVYFLLLSFLGNLEACEFTQVSLLTSSLTSCLLFSFFCIVVKN